MNKLFDISRKDGYPLCAETVEALNSNTRYIESIMDGFNIGYRQAIILSGNTPEMYMYIKDSGWSTGKIVKTSTSISNMTRQKLLDTPQGYKLIDISDEVHIDKLNSTIEQYEKCILQEAYEIVDVVSNDGWTFMEMTDFLVPEKMTTIYSENFDVFDKSLNPIQQGVGFGGVIRISKCKTRLYIRLNGTYPKGFTGDILIKLPPSIHPNFHQRELSPLTAISTVRYLTDDNWPHPNLWDRDPIIVPAFIASYEGNIKNHIGTYIALLCGSGGSTHGNHPSVVAYDVNISGSVIGSMGEFPQIAD